MSVVIRNGFCPALSIRRRRKRRPACLSRCSLSIESSRFPSRFYGTTKISPAATDLDVSLVQIPVMTSCTPAFSTKILAHQRRKPKLPNPYRFVADFKSSLQKKLCNVTASELVSQSPEHCHQHDVVREWRSLNVLPERSL